MKWQIMGLHARQTAFAAVCLVASQSSYASDCEILEPWYTQGHPAPASTNVERVAQSHLEYELRRSVADALDSSFRSGTLDRDSLEACLAPLPDRQNFLETLYWSLFKNSLQKLDASKSPAVQVMMRLFHSKYGAAVPIFRVTGSFKETADTPLGAGFHRGTGSIYMDFATIHPDDWLIIFVHETLHALDDQIWKGMELYAKSDIPKKYVELSSRVADFSDLSSEQQSELRVWLTAGMDRGLLAEYRAWTATFAIYAQGLAEGLWSPRPWLEEVLAKRPADETLEAFTYRYLDGRSQDPSDGVFSNPLIQSGLKAVREELRRAERVPLYGFEALL